MRFASTGIDEVVDNVPWLVEKRLQVIEELALEPQGTGTADPSIADAIECLHKALDLRDREAEDEAVVDLIGAEMRVWWLDFPERQLLADLYRRAGRRKAGRGSADSRRRPSHSEGLRVARSLLAETEGKSLLDPARESQAVTEFLVRHWRSHPEQCQNCALEDYIERSEDRRSHFDALVFIVVIIESRGEKMPYPLLIWRIECELEIRRRPPLLPYQAHRPVNSDNLVRDIQIHFTIEILRRAGVAPRGTQVSGCLIVSEVLGLTEITVACIWKERIWKKPLEPVLRKYLEAISERNGLKYDAEA